MPRGVYLRPALHRTFIPPYEIVRAGETWRIQAACQDHPVLRPEAWDDSVDGDRAEGGERRVKRIAAAVDVCRNECPVCAECLRDADLEWDEGVRGGVDLRQLREAQKRKGRAS